MRDFTFIQNKYTKWYFNIIINAQNRDVTGYTEKHHIIPKSMGGTNDINNLVKLTAKEHFICHRLLIRMVNGIYKRKMSFALCMMLAKNKNHERTYNITARTYEKLRKELSLSMKEYWTADLKLAKSIATSGENNPFYNKRHSEETINKLKNKIVSTSTRAIMSSNAIARFKDQPGTFLGKTHTEDTRKKMSISASKPKSEEWKKSASLNRKGRAAPNKGIPHLESTKQKIREAVSGPKNGFYGKQHSPEQREKKRQEKLNSPRLACPYCSKIVDIMNFKRWHNDKCKHKN